MVDVNKIRGVAGSYGGIRLIPSYLLTETATKKITRTWLERLWSWPWRPMQATKTETYQIPCMKPIIYDNRTWFAHPAYIKRIEAELKLIEGENEDARKNF